MHTNRTFRLDDDEVKAIFVGLQAHRLHEVYDNNSMKNLHEVLVDVFQTDIWTKPQYYDQRNVFIETIKGLNADPADHRRAFMAMAEAANPHAVVAYMRLFGGKERVHLKDHSALITTEELAQMFRDRGAKMAPVSNFLCRAATSGRPGSIPLLWKAISNAFDPDARLKERMQEGMSSLVRRFGLKSLGIGDHDKDHARWVDKFFTTEISAVQEVAGAILAGQIASRHLSKEDLLKKNPEFTGKMRLVNQLGFAMEDFDIKHIIRTYDSKTPSYRIEDQLTR